MRLLIGVALVVLVAACGSSVQTTPSASASGTATPGTSQSDTASPSATAPSGSDTVPSPSATPGTSPDVSPSPAPTDTAAACSGDDKNHSFFAAFAASVSWNVYCPVLPDGWFVESGSYHLRDGGELDIAYRGPGGAHLELKEGSFCADGASACAPHDQWLGAAQLGDLQGQLGSLDGGSTLVIYVDPGDHPAWQLSATGLDRQTFVGIAAALTAIPR